MYNNRSSSEARIEISCLNPITQVGCKYWSNKCIFINILGVLHTLLTEEAGLDRSLSYSTGYGYQEFISTISQEHSRILLLGIIVYID